MIVQVLDSYGDISHRAAGVVADLVRRRPHAVLGLPTGSTPEGFYKALVHSGADFSGVRTFNLDEYLGLPASHPQSYAAYMRTRLFNHVNIRPENRHIPDGMASDPERECHRYEEAIRAAGGLDLVVLGLGLNGHIGFNEPGTRWDARTRRVTLADATRGANARFFGSLDETPREAITMGIGTITEARKILLLASGSAKAEIVRLTVEGEPGPNIPSSVLRHHSEVLVLVDREAAGWNRRYA